ncbi:MAG TPA: hypothetical protein VD907_05635 [Verrucomicrobiae bacterium]|nr:hypothetical protein [Verrucomicrobiae bacterium]
MTSTEVEVEVPTTRELIIFAGSEMVSRRVPRISPRNGLRSWQFITVDADDQTYSGTIDVPDTERPLTFILGKLQEAGLPVSEDNLIVSPAKI